MLVCLVLEIRGMFICFGLSFCYQNAIFNVVVMVCDGEVVGFVVKWYLVGDGVYYEFCWFKFWFVGIRGMVLFGGGFLFIGDLYFNVGGVWIGFEICEDVWVAI